MKKENKFIVFEGIDGVGKTTLCNYLVDLYKNDNKEVKLIRGLGTGEVGNYIRSIFLSDSNELSNLEKCVAIVLSLTETSRIARNYINEGYTVICDRFIPSFYVYQVKTLKYPKSMLLLNNILSKENKDFYHPDIYLNCNIDKQIIKDRIKNRDNNNWLDKQDHIDSLIEGYNVYFEDHNFINTINIDCNPDLETVKLKLMNIYLNHLV